ncbi:helix-turn-helix domain-containing protein [Bacillaceae bacterium SIJ1]|uniref:helix-turn-helix domain-containing protein n=1 Tax=Litoribacterium kuwaitense TaxID=1398745 RepID=UPI0013EBA68B|nr:helix-turn-helix domain-containing protein [Litoribacterium kuwaitense]NGP46789.1 helix-turn-helix domain-containing protein [Litoribacterium kuwaitense]
MLYVLIADPCSFTRQHIRNSITEWGYHVIGEAASRQEAKQLIYEKGWPNVVITDIMYPELEGLSLVNDIYKRKLPMATIVIGESQKPQYIRQAMRTGAIDYLFKPLCFQEMYDALAQTMDVIQRFQNHRQLHHIHQFFEQLWDRSPHEILKEQSRLLSEIFYLQEKCKGEKQGMLYIFSAKWEQAYCKENIPVMRQSACMSHREDTVIHFRRLAEQWIKHASGRNKRDTSLIIEQVCDYVHKNHYQTLTLSEVCQQFNMSASYLSKRFKEQTNCTFIQYVNRVRIEKAKEFLFQSDLFINEIAQKCGFPTIQYFNRAFKKKYSALRKSTDKSMEDKF